MENAVLGSGRWEAESMSHSGVAGVAYAAVRAFIDALRKAACAPKASRRTGNASHAPNICPQYNGKGLNGFLPIYSSADESHHSAFGLHDGILIAVASPYSVSRSLAANAETYSVFSYVLSAGTKRPAFTATPFAYKHGLPTAAKAALRHIRSSKINAARSLAHLQACGCFFLYRNQQKRCTT